MSPPGSARQKSGVPLRFPDPGGGYVVDLQRIQTPDQPAAIRVSMPSRCAGLTTPRPGSWARYCSPAMSLPGPPDAAPAQCGFCLQVLRGESTGWADRLSNEEWSGIIRSILKIRIHKDKSKPRPGAILWLGFFISAFSYLAQNKSTPAGTLACSCRILHVLYRIICAYNHHKKKTKRPSL